MAHYSHYPARKAKSAFSRLVIIQLFLPVLLTVALFIGVIFLLILPDYEDTIMDRKREVIRELTNEAWSDLAAFEQKEREGLLAREEAQAMAIEHVRALRYGPEHKDYFWINDRRPYMVMHPYQPELDGHDLSSYADPNGKRLFVEMVKEVDANPDKAGYVDYMWQWKDDPDQIVPKVSYVRLFEPWGWIIGTGLYVNDVHHEIAQITRKLTLVSAGVLSLVLLLSAYTLFHGLQTERKRASAEAELSRHRDHLEELVEERTAALEHAQEALKDSEQTLASIISFLPDATFVVDLSGKVIAWNRAMEELSGVRASDMLGKGDFQYAEPFYGERRPILIDMVFRTDEEVRRAYPNAVREKDVYVTETYSAHFKKGAYLWGKAGPLYDAHGNAAGAIESVRDITDRVRAEEELVSHREHLEELVVARTSELTETNRQLHLEIEQRERSEKERVRLATAIEQAAEAIIVTDSVGVMQYVNPAFVQITGYDRHEAIGHQLDSVVRLEKDSARLFEEMRTTVESGEAWQGRMRGRRKSGEPFEAEVTVSPVRDAAGRVINFVAVQRDVTHETELEARLLQGQKLEALGTLAGGIAHDFNNILQVVMGYADMAGEELSENQAACNWLSEIITAASRGADLVNQILTFSRQTEQERKPMLLQPVIKEALKLLRGSLPSTIEIRQNVSSACGPVLADPTRIHQVVMNLCTNAYHAMRENGGILEVTLAEVMPTCELVNKLPELAPGKYARIQVKDTGHGMTTSIRERIFEPYFTTKEASEGTGLGLATVHGIVTSLNGAISVESEPGRGTSFFVYLPICISQVEPSNQHGADVGLLGGTERILFVDDEGAIAQLQKEALERFGYDVDAHSNSVRALEAFSRNPDGYDIVVTDQTMPGLAGVELAKELLRIRPSIPIILCTGFSEVIGEEKAKSLGIREFVKKPIVVRQLMRAIRQCLEKPE